MKQDGIGRPCTRSWTRWIRGAQYIIAVTLTSIGLNACRVVGNDPYPASQSNQNILYSAFVARPRYLDPARAYNADEYEFLGQICEPPLQYQYLDRPYRLVPLTATRVPLPVSVDRFGQPVPAGSPRARYTRVRIHIRPGIHYQPEPYFSRLPDGHHRYFKLTSQALRGRYRLADFHDVATRELTAADYVYEIKRLADPALHSPIYGLLSQYIVGWGRFGVLVGQHPGSRVSARLLQHTPLTGVRVISRYVYEIDLKRPYPQFRYWLAMPFFAPMPWEADRFYGQKGMRAHDLSLNWYPVGTGPYMLTENDPARRIVLVRNPEFHGETFPRHGAPGDRRAGLLTDAGRPLPFVQKAVFSLEKEGIPYWNKFLQGWYDRSQIGSSNFDQAIRVGANGHPRLSAEMHRRGMDLAVQTQPSVYFYGFNMQDPIVGGNTEKGRALRRALSIALNTEQEIAIFQNGRGLPAQGPIPPGIFGHGEGRSGLDPYVYRWMNGKPRRRTLEDARQWLMRAGYPRGFNPRTGRPLVLYYDAAQTGPTDQARFSWLRKKFRQLGIDLIVRATDYNRFQDKVRHGDVQIFSWGWNADYPDPENFLFLLYGPNSKTRDGGENVANYSNPDFDQLFLEMRDMPDSPLRARLIARMVHIVQRDAPWIWGYYPEQYVLSQPWYFNGKPNAMATNTLKYVRINTRLRAQLRKRWNQPVWWPLGLWALVPVVLAAVGVGAYRRRDRRRPL